MSITNSANTHIFTTRQIQRNSSNTAGIPTIRLSISLATFLYLLKMTQSTRDVRNELLISIWRLQISRAQKYSFHALEVLPVARNAKFQPMYPLFEGVTVRWFGHSIRYWWMADPSACRDWYFRPARNAFNFGNKKKSHGARSGEYGGEAKQLLFLSSKTP